ncbi:MAG: histidine kinase, partial [Chitinophagaceae bacterium]|nr:histidine kinase [Chitinophagaceae bacterium]
MNDLLPIDRTNKFRVYFFYWFTYILFFTFIQAGPNQEYLTAFLTELISLPLKIVFVYIVLQLLMKRLLFERKSLLFVLAYLPLLLLFAFLQRLADNYINLRYFLNWEVQPLLEPGPYVHNILKFQFVAAIPFSSMLFSYWAKEKNKSYIVEGQKMQAELTFLRNQFHPHFIFNVLNSLYSKILNKSEDSADIVLKISSLIRFTLYDINTPSISVDKEISYLQDYIALQRMRFDRQLELSISITGDYDNKYIEPFLIIPFVENSFKYCIDEDSGKGWITIYISIIDDWLTLKIENSINTGVP